MRRDARARERIASAAVTAGVPIPLFIGSTLVVGMVIFLVGLLTGHGGLDGLLGGEVNGPGVFGASNAEGWRTAAARHVERAGDGRLRVARRRAAEPVGLTAPARRRQAETLESRSSRSIDSSVAVSKKPPTTSTTSDQDRAANRIGW